MARDPISKGQFEQELNAAQFTLSQASVYFAGEDPIAARGRLRASRDALGRLLRITAPNELAVRRRFRKVNKKADASKQKELP